MYDWFVVAGCTYYGVVIPQIVAAFTGLPMNRAAPLMSGIAAGLISSGIVLG